MCSRYSFKRVRGGGRPPPEKGLRPRVLAGKCSKTATLNIDPNITSRSDVMVILFAVVLEQTLNILIIYAGISLDLLTL